MRRLRFPEIGSRKCEPHDWELVIHPLSGGRKELLGVNCERCGAYYGYRSPFNKHAGRKLGTLAKWADD